MKVDICFSPALYPYYAENNDKIVIVTDIFRATTSICTAFQNGTKSIIPVATIEEAKEYKKKGYLVGAERNVKRCDFADFGNSPFDYIREKVEGQEIVFTTTNGTQAIKQASNCYSLVIGAFSNLSAIADFCLSHKKDIIVLCAGWNNKFNIEDTLYGGAIAEKLIKKGYSNLSDSTLVALQMWDQAKMNMRKYIDQSEHIKRLIANNLHDSVDYCLKMNTTSVVPIYDDQTNKLIIV